MLVWGVGIMGDHVFGEWAYLFELQYRVRVIGVTTNYLRNNNRSTVVIHKHHRKLGKISLAQEFKIYPGYV